MSTSSSMPLRSTTATSEDVGDAPPPPVERQGSGKSDALTAERAALFEESLELQELCRDNGLSASQFARRGAAVTALDTFLGFWRSMKSVMHFPALRELSVVHHPTVTVLEGVTHCPLLEVLCVTECGIERIAGLDNCVRLRKLNLSGNRIRHLEGLDRLVLLETLWVNDNLIESLDGLWKLTQLKQLWACRNRVEHIDTALSCCVNLTDLNLADNRVSSFKSLLSLTNLEHLSSLTLSDPHYGDNPVCRLCNYQTYVMCHLGRLTCLDTVELSARNKQIAEATMIKKKMYYNMRIKAIKRDIRARIKHSESIRSQAEQQIEYSLAALVREKKEIERYIADLTARSKGIDDAATPVADCQAVQELKKKLECVDQCLKNKYSVINRMNYEYNRLRTSLQSTSDINIARLLLELETGGNIRLEDGKPSDAWFASCVDLVRSRLFPAELHALNIHDIRINRVTRISNRYLRHRFHARMDEVVTVPEQILKENVSKKGVTVCSKEPEDQVDEHDMKKLFPERQSADLASDPDSTDRSAALEDTMEYLFYMQPPHFDHPQRNHGLEQFFVAENGFREPNEYASMGIDGAIKLANSVALLDLPRLVAALTVKGKLLRRQQVSPQDLYHHSTQPISRQKELTMEMKEALQLVMSGDWELPSGVLLVVKVFPGYSKCVASLPESKQSSTGVSVSINARDFPGLHSVQVPYVTATATGDATVKQKYYYLFDKALVLPEYLIEYQYIFAPTSHIGASDKPQSNETQVPQIVSASHSPETPDFGVAIKLVEDFERRYRLRRSPPAPTSSEDSSTRGIDDSVSKVLNMEPILPVIESIDKSQVVSLRLGAAEVSKVKHLNLMGCGLENIPGLTCLQNQLEVLVLSYNNIQNINHALVGLPKLQSLDLSFNQICRLEHLEDLEGLQSLEMNSNQLRAFEDVEYLGRTFRGRALRHVDLRKNPLCGRKRYRLHVLKYLSVLECLDKQYVTKDETLAAQQLVTKLSSAKIWDHFCNHRGALTEATSSSSNQRLVAECKSENDDDSTPTTSCSISEFQPCWDAMEEITFNRELISEVEGFENARNLRVAIFADNVIKRIGGLDQCSKLEELSLEDNEISKIENIETLVSLKKLHLGRNRISVIECLDTLENLTQLSLEENQISSLQGLGSALKLMELYIGSNQIEILKEIQHLKSLPKLTILDLSGNEIARLPDYRLYTVFYLRRVKVLDGVSITPQDQSDAKQKYSGKLTTEFILEKCGSDSKGGSARGNGGSGFSNPLERILDMDLSSCRIREIGSISGRMFVNIRELNLENNQIAEISGLEMLPKLRILNLNRNRIEKLLPTNSPSAFTIPEEFEGKGIFACLGLEQLYLAYNQISDMSTLGLQFLDELKVLHLQGNTIMFLSGLDSSTELRELRLDRNRIRQLDSSSTAALRQLRILTLEDNGLKSLSNFVNLLSLEMLDLSNNRLVDIEEVDKLASASRIVDLRLTNNPLTKKHLYRQNVLYKLSFIKSLDGREVSADEQERVAVLFAHERATATVSAGANNAGSNNFNERCIEARAYGNNAQVTLTPSSIPSKSASNIASGAFSVTACSSSTRTAVPQFVTGEVLAGTLLRKHPHPTMKQSQNQQQQQLLLPSSKSSYSKSDHATDRETAILPSNTPARSFLVDSQATSHRSPSSLTNQRSATMSGVGGGSGGVMPSAAVSTSTVTVASAFSSALSSKMSPDHFHLGGLRSDRRRMTSVHYDQAHNGMHLGNSGVLPSGGSPGNLSTSNGELKFPVGIVSSLAVVRGPSTLSGQGGTIDRSSSAESAAVMHSVSSLNPKPAQVSLGNALDNSPVFPHHHQQQPLSQQLQSADERTAATCGIRRNGSRSSISNLAASSLYTSQKRYPAYPNFQPEATIPFLSTKLNQGRNR